MPSTNPFPARFRRLGSALCTSAALLLPAFATAADWSIRNLGTLGGGEYSEATDINNLGQVVGFAPGPEHLHNGADLMKLPHAFLSAPNGGPLQDVGPSVYDISYAFGVNNLGQTVGRAALNISMDVGFVTGPNGARLPLEIDTPTGRSLNGTPYLVLRDINNRGQILGYDVFGNSSFLTRSDGVTMIHFPYDAGAQRVNDAGQVAISGNDGQARIWSEAEGMRPLGEGVRTAVDINSAGQVIGQMGRAGEYGRTGYITGANGIGPRPLATLGGNLTDPRGINAFGQVVGISETVSGEWHAFLSGPNGGPLLDLEALPEVSSAGWSDLIAAAINDAGQIAGTGFINGQRRAFFLSPIPEPGTYSLMFLGLAAVGSLVRQRAGSGRSAFEVGEPEEDRS